jgi:hypothetical protein
MFRRVANICATRSFLPIATVLVDTSAALPPYHQLRFATTNTSADSANQTRINAVNRQRARRANMPPAFDIVHWNDNDVSRGHLLRVLHRNGYIVLDYHRQRHPSPSPSSAADDDAAATTSRRENRAERVVSVTLPPVYVARFLGVLEGRMDKVEVQSRFTNATFVPNAAAGPHHYTLRCTSMKPTTGQVQTVDGADVHEETVEWTVELDAAESLMLHRFLTQAFHLNSGFARSV